MRTQEERRLETSHSLVVLKALRKLLDQVGVVAERGIMSGMLNPAALYLCMMAVHENEFVYREHIDMQIKILQEEQVFYGD